MLLPLQMPGQAGFQESPYVPESFDDGEVEDRRPEIGLIVEGAGKGVAGLAHQIVDRHDGDDCGALHHQHEFVAIGPERYDQCLRQDDLCEGNLQPECQVSGTTRHDPTQMAPGYRDNAFPKIAATRAWAAR